MLLLLLLASANHCTDNPTTLPLVQLIAPLLLLPLMLLMLINTKNYYHEDRSDVADTSAATVLVAMFAAVFLNNKEGKALIDIHMVELDTKMLLHGWRSR